MYSPGELPRTDRTRILGPHLLEQRVAERRRRSLALCASHMQNIEGIEVGLLSAATHLVTDALEVFDHFRLVKLINRLSAAPDSLDGRSVRLQ